MPEPAVRDRAKAAALVVLIALAALFGMNYTTAYRQLRGVLKADVRNAGISAFSYHAYGVQPDVMVFDVWGVSPDSSALDVFRVLLQFAEAKRGQMYKEVRLSYRGKTRFVMSGAFFFRAGSQYSWQNPIALAREFTADLKTPDGEKAYAPSAGGWIATMTQQIDDFTDAHRRWYMDDTVKSLGKR